MTVGELCNRTVAIVERHEGVVEAARRMREHHVGTVVVIERREGRAVPVGIVTDRDIVVRAVATRPDELEGLRVADLMTSDLVTAAESEHLEAVVARMRSHGVRRLPVVDAGGVLVGIVAFDDVVELLAEQLGSLAALLSREQRRERESLELRLPPRVLGERVPPFTR